MKIQERGKIASISLIVALVLVLLLLLWKAVPILLVLFAGVLLAVFLRALTNVVARLTRLSDGWSYTIVLLSLLILLGLSGVVLFPSVSFQIDRLTAEFPAAMEQLRQSVIQYEWANWLASRVMEDTTIEPGVIVSGITGAVTSLVVILFVGLYLAVNPSLYERGLVKLVPVSERDRAEELLAALGSQLQDWLLGQAVSMLAVGIMTTLGLWWLDVPLALTLGLISGSLTFIPYIGPLLSLVPALVIAFTLGTETVLWVTALYLGIQSVESYLLTPAVQKQAAELPPALTISSQILLGTLIGTWGLIVATPLTAAALVFVKMVYVEDFLADSDS